MMGVAICRRVHDDLQSLAAGRGGGVAECGAAIGRADIDRGVGGRPARGERAELRRVVGREEDIVPGQRETLRLAMGEPDEGRERPAGRIVSAHRPLARLAEAAARERGGVRVADHLIRLDPLARRQDHSRDAAVVRLERCHAFTEADARAVALGQRPQRFGKRAHAAFDQPDPLRLDMGDEH